MGLTERTNRIYLSIGFGKLRMKCSPDNPKAIKRETDKGTTYAIEYTSISGTLDAIIFRDDPNYGRSWLLQITDKEQYQVQVSEESRYASDLLERIPNLVIGEIYKFTPYDFEDVLNKKRRVGLSIKTLSDEKVENYYKIYNEDKKEWIYKHGYPTYDGDWKDKDEMKIYFMRVLKFLRTEARCLADKPTTKQVKDDLPDEPANPENIVDDLPF